MSKASAVALFPCCLSTLSVCVTAGFMAWSHTDRIEQPAEVCIQVRATAVSRQQQCLRCTYPRWPLWSATPCSNQLEMDKFSARVWLCMHECDDYTAAHDIWIYVCSRLPHPPWPMSAFFTKLIIAEWPISSASDPHFNRGWRKAVLTRVWSFGGSAVMRWGQSVDMQLAP